MTDEPTTTKTCNECGYPLKVTASDVRERPAGSDLVAARCNRVGCPDRGVKIYISRGTITMPGID